MINGVLITPLKIIETSGGNVLHSLKDTDSGFNGFGEAYFSEIEPKAIKAWKLHKKMTLNISVPIGKIKFVLYDERIKSNCFFQEFIISRKNYSRLTIPPMIWLGFQGLANSNSLLLNVADISHSTDEVIRRDLSEIVYKWSK
jgi:dTDP-4-dehydrorhamnose 3,5-epimerase